MNENCYAGIDVGGTSAKIGIVNEKGEIVEKTQVPTRQTKNFKAILDDFIKPIHKWIDGGLPLRAVGVGTPGYANKKTGCMFGCENIPGFVNQPVLSYLKSKFDIPVFLDNDATCATIGEHLFGAGREFTDYILVTIGTGIGGGIILNDRIYRGFDGYAGEIGHMLIQAEGRDCTCGNYGCIEPYSSASSIIKRIKDGIKKGYITTYGDVVPEEINAKIIFEKAGKGDVYSMEAVDSAARYLGWMIGSAVNLLNPEAILIGGGVAASGDFFIGKVKKYADQVAWHTFTENLKILPAKLLNDAGIMGAASLAISELRAQKN
jgi:glucokinase